MVLPLLETRAEERRSAKRTHRRQKEFEENQKIKLSVRPPHGPNPLTADSQLVFQILLRLEALVSAEQAQEATHFDKKRSNLEKMFKQSLEVCHSE